MILSLDIRTLLVVLVLGNALAILLLFFATRKVPWKYDSLFMIGRVFQLAAWVLIAMRGIVPDLLSFYFGNSLMFCGVTLEGLCLLSLKREIGTGWRIAFASQLAVMLLAWWTLGPAQGAKFLLSSIFDAALFAIPGCALVSIAGRTSSLQKFIGATLLLCSLSTLSRGVYIAVAGSYSLTVPTIFQVFHFMVRVLEMILGSTGYILIRKEFANEELRKASEEKNLLLRELQHRVKNSLGIIASLTSLEAERNDDPSFRSSMSKVGDRINAVAELYDRLLAEDPTKGVRLDIYIRDLAERLLGGYSSDPEKIRLEFELESAEVDAKTSVAVGLIVNELATNAMKYAFPGDARGSLRIALLRREGRLELEVSDDGVGIPASPGGDAEGLGTMIVAMLAKQIGGALSRGPGPGTSVRVAF